MAWNDLSEAEKGYVAGFFDGEGSITYSTSNNRVYPIVCFYNTDKQIMDWIADIFNECTVRRTIDKRRSGGKTKDNYAVYVKRALHVKRVLEYLLPYLRIKDEQAIQTLKYLDWKLERMYRKLSEEEKEVERMYKDTIQKLNGGRSH